MEVQQLQCWKASRLSRLFIIFRLGTPDDGVLNLWCEALEFQAERVVGRVRSAVGRSGRPFEEVMFSE